LAVDHIIEADGVLMGQVQHVSSGVLSAGGKGLNLARAARCLGVTAKVVGLVGGRTGTLLRSLLAVEGIEAMSPPLARETRIATIVHDRSSLITTVLNERGPVVSPHEWSALTDLVRSSFGAAFVVICTGSLLPGVPDDGYVELIEAAQRANLPVIVDASAETLRCSAHARPKFIKVNLDEAESAIGDGTGHVPLELRARIAAERLHLISGGAVAVTVPSGAAFVHEGNAFFLRAPDVAVSNEVGAGDSFLAGLASGLLQHGDIPKAGKRAVAVASASVETPQPGHLDRDRAYEIEQLISVERYV